MAFENKLNIIDSAELARSEEKISKKKLYCFLRVDIYIL